MGLLSSRRIIAAALFGCCALAPSAHAQLKSQAASVVLIARLPDKAGVQWTLPPVPQSLESRGQSVALVVLRSQWQFAAGEAVRAKCMLAPDVNGEAELVALHTTGTPPGGYATAFLPGPPTTELHLLERFDPRRGGQEQTDALLVVGPQRQPQEPRVVRIVVTAL